MDDLAVDPFGHMQARQCGSFRSSAVGEGGEGYNRNYHNGQQYWSLVATATGFLRVAFRARRHFPAKPKARCHVVPHHSATPDPINASCAIASGLYFDPIPGAVAFMASPTAGDTKLWLRPA
ncbi:MAG TPA: hypothetical protein VH370_20885 [Humisphaera sp.]|nr:hypothetical protein [Humisphaera sp.]